MSVWVHYNQEEHHEQKQIFRKKLGRRIALLITIRGKKKDIVPLINLF
jgi:hypothetical protein